MSSMNMTYEILIGHFFRARLDMLRKTFNLCSKPGHDDSRSKCFNKIYIFTGTVVFRFISKTFSAFSPFQLIDCMKNQIQIKHI